MKADVLRYEDPVTLVGGGALTAEMVAEAQALAPVLVAADGAADRLEAWGALPEAVVGDMDSLSDPARWRGRTTLLHLAEQDTTDFEKCLYATEAPFYVAAGFTGRRVDHMLAVFHALLARPSRRVILLGEAECMALLPPGRRLRVEAGAGAVVSLFPLVPVQMASSAGLVWPVDGMEMAPGRQIGTSNRAAADMIELEAAGPGCLVILERRVLPGLVATLAPAG